MSGNNNNKKKRVGRTGEREHGLTANKMAACSQCSLARETLLLYQPGQANRREILSWCGAFLTDSWGSPIHPATHMLTITYTHIHPLRQTHCLTSQCELFGFKCELHRFPLVPDMFSANGFFQMLLEVKKNSPPLLFYFVSTFLFLVVSVFIPWCSSSK